MKTLRYVITLIVTAMGLSLAHGRADKSMVGNTLPKLDLEYLGTAPDTVGKPMIVEFWATWCPPCRTSIPHLNEIYAKHKDQGLVIIGITKESKSVVTKFLKGVPMNYAPAIDRGGALNREFKITAIPHAVLVDRTGKIVWEGHPMALKEKQIADLVKP